MELDDLDRLAAHYTGLSDDDLYEAFRLGPNAYRTGEAWRIISAEYDIRGLAAPDAKPTKPELKDITAADRIREARGAVEIESPSAQVVNRSWKWQIVAMLLGALGVALLIGSSVAKAGDAPPAVVFSLVAAGAAAVLSGTIGVFLAPEIVKRLDSVKSKGES